MRKPDYFIIGAPKCGTTAMARYLGEHERVFMTDPKEPHFFNTDFKNRHTSDIETYRDYFRTADERHLAVGEASVFYLYSRDAIRNILDFQPDARFIVMLRNPIDVAHAWHSQAVLSFGELISDFQTAWNMQGARRSGESLPASSKEPKVFLYGELAQIGHQVQRLFDQVDRERVLILMMDDMKQDTLGVYRRALEFLDVPCNGRIDFPVHNANQRVRSPRMRLLVQQARSLKHHLGIRSNLGLLKKMGELNQFTGERRPLSREFRAELIDFFAEDIALIEFLISRDLSQWKAL